jgi:hypothetical protein
MTWHTSNPIKQDDLVYSPAEIKRLIILTRFSRFNRSIVCGAEYIRQELNS